ncbi:MAG: hypothetical protein ABIP55_09770 [Tepidisphaeraceae bacterium]
MAKVVSRRAASTTKSCDRIVKLARAGWAGKRRPARPESATHSTGRPAYIFSPNENCPANPYGRRIRAKHDNFPAAAQYIIIASPLAAAVEQSGPRQEPQPEPGFMRIAVAISILWLTASIASAATNLITNGEMIPSPASGVLPPGWTPLIIGAEAKFTTDAQERRSADAQGATVRIDAAEVTRSYLRSVESIPVAPGETIDASAWVKVKDVPAGQGTVILIAEFSDADGKNDSVAKFNVADVKNSAWQEVKGSVEVPVGAARLHLRMGLSYSHGTCWWDDVTVTAKKPLVCRIDLSSARLSPAMKTLPIQILNRDRAKRRVTVRVGKEGVTVPLTGAPTQRVEAPIKVGKPGKASIELSMLGEKGGENDGEPLFSQTRTLTVPPPLAVSPPSPTHWVLEDGNPRIDGIVDLALSDDQRSNASLVVRVFDAGGKSHADWKAAQLGDGPNAFTITPPPLPEGDYRIVAELRPKQGKLLRDEQPWRIIPRHLAKVILNDAGYPVYDGKAIFPLGIFNGGKFDEQAAAGFSVTHAYNAARILPDPFAADHIAFNFIENTHRHGMKMLFMIPIKEAIEGDFDTVRRRVRMFRTHPGLLAWDEEEGFARGDFKPDTLKRIRAIVAEEDPHHPFMVGDSADVIGRSRGKPDFFPDAEMDMGMWWWYPFPLKPRAGDALQGEDGNSPATRWDVLTPPAFLTHSATKKPLWVGIQCYKKPGEGARYPTPQEYRTQAYLAIVSGAKGLMWYGGSVTGGLFLKPEEGHWDELRVLLRELRDHEDFLLAPSEPATVVPADPMISAVLKRAADGRALLIAVNRGPAAVEATIGGKAHRFDPYGVVVKRED